MKPKPIIIVMGVLASIALGYTVLHRKPSTTPAFDTTCPVRRFTS